MRWLCPAVVWEFVAYLAVGNQYSHVNNLLNSWPGAGHDRQITYQFLWFSSSNSLLFMRYFCFLCIKFLMIKTLWILAHNLSLDFSMCDLWRSTLLLVVVGLVCLVWNKKGSGYRSACGPSYFKPYSSATCNVTVTHKETAVGLAELY